MKRNAMPCHAMPCHAMPCHATLHEEDVLFLCGAVSGKSFGKDLAIQVSSEGVRVRATALVGAVMLLIETSSEVTSVGAGYQGLHLRAAKRTCRAGSRL